MEFLQNIIDGTTNPFMLAFLLGIMTAISPCPLATNITAIGYISKDLENRRQIFFNGLWYTFGRIISYTTLGVVLYFGANTFSIAKFFQTNGEKFLGPLLVIVGILMFDFFKIKFPGFNGLSAKIQNKKGGSSWWSAMLLGIVFALAFCPYSGVLYFGMLIPVTITSPSGLFLPIIFAIATGLPVIIVAYLLAFSISSIGGFYQKIKIFEKWFRLIVATVFILVGLYYIYIFYLKSIF